MALRFDEARDVVEVHRYAPVVRRVLARAVEGVAGVHNDASFRHLGADGLAHQRLPVARPAVAALDCAGGALSVGKVVRCPDAGDLVLDLIARQLHHQVLPVTVQQLRLLVRGLADERLDLQLPRYPLRVFGSRQTQTPLQLSLVHRQDLPPEDSLADPHHARVRHER